RGTVELNGLASCRVRELNKQLVISPETLDMAIRFIDGYLRPHLARVYHLGESADRGAKEGRALARVIIEEPAQEMTVTDVVHRHRAGLNTSSGVKNAFAYLHAMGWGRYDERDQSRSKKPTARFFVNPQVFEKAWSLGGDEGEEE